MRNPFVTNGYAGPQYFCDRKEETRVITSLVCNQNNVALISPRRLGKTDLIRHCFAQPEICAKYYTFEIDIYATGSLNDFVNMFGKAVLDTLRPLGRTAWEKFLQILASLKSEISFDINGSPVWGMGVGQLANPIVTFDEIFTYLREADRPCLVAIDEFQQILRYPDGEMIEAALRTYIQRCPNAYFIFSGSHRHLMGAMFVTPSRPFYQSVSIVNLSPIPYEAYLEFCTQKFAEHDKTLDSAVVESLYQKFEQTTLYMQKVMNALFAATPVGGHCDLSMVENAISDILALSSDTYETLLRQMPEKQRNTFFAIAAEGKATSISSGAFIKKYRLPSASSVLSAMKGLLEKDFVTQHNGVYYVYDHFFVLWLRSKGYIK